MKSEIETQLKAIAAQVQSFSDSFVQGGLSTHSLEVIDTAKSEVTIKGNSAGLIYLAKCCLDLAASQAEGKHFHLDEQHMLDRADRELVLTFAKAKWDSAD